MKNWSIPVGRLFGIDVRVHLTFFFLLVFIWFTDSVNAGPSGAARGLALLGIILGSVVLHELGHGLAALHAQFPIRAIILLPIGGITVMDEAALLQQPDAASDDNSARRWQREVRVAIAGPLVNFAIAFIAVATLLAVAPQVKLWSHPLVHSGALLRSLVWINVVLGVLNLLPAYPTDGGRILRAGFIRRMSYVQATRRAVTVGQAFSMLFIFAGLWNTWLMLIGFFLFVGAQLEERSVMFQSVLEAVHLEDIMLTDFATLSPADTLEDALNKAVHSLQDDFPVVRGSDMVGVISRQSILDALRAEGNSYVQSAMSKAYDVAHKSESLASAFRKISARGATLIPVVENERLVGIVTLQNLMHSMSLLAETRRLRRVNS
jgi:Zn-dependent protease/predicted transcriptional regulator